MFDLQEFLPYRLYQAAEHTSQLFSDAYRQRYGINRTQWRVLFNVGQFGPLTAGEIGERTGLEKSKVSRAVVRLETLGWVLREPDERDRRRQGLTLTEAGKEAFRDLRAQAEVFQNQLINQLGVGEVAALVAALRVVDQVMKAAPE
ncbi:MAG: MarR family winged helix-turn-helix transcriptional regulator [Pseudomonadota bacterium]